VNWSLDDFPQFEFVFGTMMAMNYPRQLEQYWRDEFDFAASQCSDGLFSLTLHPQVIGRGSRLAMLERLIDYYREHCEFVRMLDYASSWRQKNPLDQWCYGESLHLGQSIQ
jgi:peptidoglycan/xylan/chitin deacetylase (PgdA/CDA1 family)